MNKEELEKILNEGKSTYEVAAMVGHKSNSTVRSWMKKYGLKSIAKSGRKGIKSNLTSIHDGKLTCASCMTEKTLDNYIIRKDRNNYHSYCKECMNDTVSKRYVNLKSKLIKLSGDECSRCKMQYPLAAYSFHHTEPEHKDFNFANRRYNSVESVLNELDKCILVCQNCHAEIHHEMSKDAPLSPKNAKNTERWNKQREYKLNYVNFEEPKCSGCGYDKYLGALNIIFPDSKAHYKKYNRNFENWEDDFKQALNESRILCFNCARVDTLSETTQNNIEELKI